MRTWATINLDHLIYNLQQIRKHLPDETKVMAIVKADGYGHGDQAVTRVLAENHVDFFGVSNLEEALRLRETNISLPILILGFTPVRMASILAEKRIVQTVFSKEYAILLNEECKKQNKRISIHIKIDTGMGRIGFPENNILSSFMQIKETCALPFLQVEGIFSHLSSADSTNSASIAYTHMQQKRFCNLLAQLERAGIQIPAKHLQNSAGLAYHPMQGLTHVRAGILLYGLHPGSPPLPFLLKPVMAIKSVISMCKTVPAGTAISYGRKFITPQEMKIATVPIGYADGYPRLLSGKGELLVKGQRAPILGNICMDQLMLDVSHIDNVTMGDIVTVVGQDGEDQITFEELAEKIGTINYELACLTGLRIPRIYIKNREPIVE